MMSLLFKMKIKVLILLMVCLFVIYSEIFSYSSRVNSWKDLSCDLEDCTKILLVGDPQIIGLKSGASKAIAPFTIYDSDRYLAKTYHNAYEFTKPDVVIFLGDLFYEGMHSSDKEFEVYLKRFKKIFNLQSNKSRYIYLPGDNDIGGDGKLIKLKKLVRFQKAFNQSDTVNYRNIKFYKVNLLTKAAPKNIPIHAKFSDTTTIMIALSHIPFLHSVIVNKVLREMRPHIIFTAHDHVSKVIPIDAKTRRYELPIIVNPNVEKIHTFKLGANNMYEVAVPTCSYRKGNDEYGYGFAVIKNDVLYYTALGLPNRFKQLKMYIIVSFFIVVAIIVNCYRKVYKCLEKAMRSSK